MVYVHACLCTDVEGVHICVVYVSACLCNDVCVFKSISHPTPVAPGGKGGFLLSCDDSGFYGTSLHPI